MPTATTSKLSLRLRLSPPDLRPATHECLQEMLHLLREVDTLDPNGQAFRYSRMKQTKGQAVPSFEKQELYDVRTLGNRLKETLRYLADGVASWLADEIDFATDHAAEMRSYLPEDYGP